MKIYFFRHGEAQGVPGIEDKDRPLTSFGAATVNDVARRLKDEIGSPDAILTSPMLRAKQTADIVGSLFKMKDMIVETENLMVGTAPSALINELKKKSAASVVVVGHQPHLGECVSLLTGKTAEKIEIKKANCLLVESEGLKEGQGKLVWSKAPSMKS